METLNLPKLSDWKCYLFGSREDGIVYTPIEGNVPNFFIRYMMKAMLGCQWVKNKNS